MFTLYYALMYMALLEIVSTNPGRQENIKGIVSCNVWCAHAELYSELYSADRLYKNIVNMLPALQSLRGTALSNVLVGLCYLHQKSLLPFPCVD